MNTRRTTLLLSLSLAGIIACVDAPPDEGRGDDIDACFTCQGKADAPLLEEGSCAANQVLELASTADLATLDYEVRLDARAALGISEHGAFSTLAELDAIPYVGPFAFGQLIDYAASLNALSCDALALTEGDPNTEFGETFIALQEEMSDECMPFGGAFFYDAVLTPSDFAVAESIVSIFSSSSDAAFEIETGIEKVADFEPFLASFGLDLPGLHSAIGFDDYELVRVRLSDDAEEQDIMVLHYRNSKEVWTVSLSCSLGD